MQFGAKKLDNTFCMNFLQEYFMKTYLDRNKILQSEIILTHFAEAQDREEKRIRPF